MDQHDILAPPPAPPGGFRSSKRRFVAEIVVIAAIIVIGGGILLLSSSWIARFALRRVPISIDKSLGGAAAEQLQVRVCPNPEATAYVKQLVSPILAQLGPSEFEWEFVALDDATVNAFALPGGYVFVNDGLIQQAATGQEIAGVLAHELSHVVLRHGMQKVLRQAGSRLILGLIFGVSDVGVLLQYGAELKDLSYQRDHETEADQMGQELLKKAGISPHGMAKFFNRLSEQGVGMPEFLSTHPDSDKRSQIAREASSGFQQTTTLPSPRNIRCRLSPATM